MDFVKFYIVQLIKQAASRIRLADKEKEKLLAKLVARIESSQDLFPDLKLMESVIELEETASKLISIYRRLHKSPIELEKISYQFVSDRDAIQSMLRRFLQGNFRQGITKKKRPKIVFDDTTFTIYELKEPEELEIEESKQDDELKKRIDLVEFLRTKEEQIISVSNYENSLKGEGVETEDAGLMSNLKVKTSIDEKLSDKVEIDNGMAKKSLTKSGKEKESESKEEELVLPLEFEWSQKPSVEIEKSESQEKISEIFEEENRNLIFQSEFFEPEEKTEVIQDEVQIQKIDQLNINEFAENEKTKQLKEIQSISETVELNEPVEELKVDVGGESLNSDEIEQTEESKISEELMNSLIEQSDSLYLDFEKLVLDNVAEIDEALTKLLNREINDEAQLKLLQNAYRAHQLAKELNFDFISEIIKVYWSALAAIRDERLELSKTVADLIRSTLIILVALIKQKEIDLEHFMHKHNKLKEMLKSLDYEV